MEKTRALKADLGPSGQYADIDWRLQIGLRRRTAAEPAHLVLTGYLRRVQPMDFEATG